MAVFDFLPGQIPSGEHLGEFDTYNPTLTATTTNPNLGSNGIASGWYYRTGKRLVVAQFRLVFDGTGTSAGSGTYIVSLPLPADTSIMFASTAQGSGSIIGNAGARDASSITNNRSSTVQLRDANTVFMPRSHGDSGTFSDSVPFVWTTGDVLHGHILYIIEPGV